MVATAAEHSKFWKRVFPIYFVVLLGDLNILLHFEIKAFLVQVVAPTAVVMILFSSSTIALSYFFSGELNTQYAWVFSPICFVAAFIGVTMIGRVVRRSGRASLLIFILTGLIAVGTVLAAGFGGHRAYLDIKSGKNIGFGSFC